MKRVRFIRLLALGCSVLTIIITGVMIWGGVQIWGVYRGEMVWLVALHRARFIAVNGRPPFDGRELNIWYGRRIGNGDRLPPLDFEGGLFNCGNRDVKALDAMTRRRLQMVDDAPSLDSRLCVMGLNDKIELQEMVDMVKNRSTQFDLRYEILRNIGMLLSLDRKYGDGHISDSERITALELLWKVAEDEASPFRGIAWYGLIRNVDRKGMEKLRQILHIASTKGKVNPVNLMVANYLQREFGLVDMPELPQTNANLKVRRIVGANGENNSDAAPCILDEDAQRLSSRIPSGMSSSERAQMAADTNSVKGKSEYGF